MAAIKKIPMRKCTGCGQMKTKKELIRVLRTNEGEIVIDTTGKKNGRGAYICLDEECLKKAIKNKGLERSLGVAMPEGLSDRLKEAVIPNESE